MRALREEVDYLKKSAAPDLAAEVIELRAIIGFLSDRVKELEAKRGPGRPRKEYGAVEN
jgi:hypothetical protein